MRLVDGGDDLSEEVASVGLPESSPRADVAVHVPVARREHQVDVLLPNNHLLEMTTMNDKLDWIVWLEWIGLLVWYLDGVDPRVAIDPIVGGKQALSTCFSTHNLQTIRLEYCCQVFWGENRKGGGEF